MNRFADIMKKTLHSAPPALGFRPAAAVKKPHMLLVAGLTSLEAGETWSNEGADVLLFKFEPTPTLKTLKQAAQLASGRPWGLFVRSGGKAVEQANKAGSDFVVFEPAVMDISILDYTDLGKVLFIGDEVEDVLLKSGSDLPFEAVIMEHTRPYISWQDLMYFRKVAAFVSKPLLLTVSQDITEKGLQALWASGIDGVIIYTADIAALGRIRQNIDSTIFPERGKGAKMRLMVPMFRGEVDSPPDEREHEDDEDEE